MDRVVIVGCNGGTDIALGGGAYLVTAMSKCLSEHGYEVHLVSTIGAEKEELARIHGWELGDNVHTHYLIHFRSSVRLPYVAAIMALSRFRNLIRKLNPSFVIYNDDYPLSIANELRRDKVPRILYVHFPYLVRRRLGFDFMHNTTEWSLVESVINYSIIDRLFGDLHDLDFIFTNSQGTRNILINVESVDKGAISALYPPVKPVDTEVINKGRPMFLHAARQDKTFLSSELYSFVDNMRRALPNSIFLINRNKDRRLYELADNKHVFVTQWLSGDNWRRALKLGKYYLHFKWFEGLGIATVEAVLNGAVPIVYRSVFNGSWTDIARLCNEDCAFSTVDEAINNVLNLESDRRKFKALSQFLISELRGKFNYEAFCQSLINIIKKYT